MQVAFTSNPGTGTQTFLQAVDAIPPTPVTVTTSQTASTTTGANISVPAGTLGETDTARLLGTNASTATGTMAYNLYSTSSCTDLTLSAGTTAVTAGKSISSPVTKVLNPGKYYWKAVYSGDALNDPGSTACASEVLTITGATTLPSSATSNGSTLTITCSAPCVVTVTIELPTGSVSAASAARKRKVKVVRVASGRFTLHKQGKKKLTLKFTPKGKALFKKDHGNCVSSPRPRGHPRPRPTNALPKASTATHSDAELQATPSSALPGSTRSTRQRSGPFGSPWYTLPAPSTATQTVADGQASALTPERGPSGSCRRCERGERGSNVSSRRRVSIAVHWVVDGHMIRYRTARSILTLVADRGERGSNVTSTP